MISKRTLWVAIVVSMIVGGAAGFLTDRGYFRHSSSHFAKGKFLSYMTKELNLTTVQQRELDSIVTYVHPKFQSIRDRFSADMRGQADSTRQMINRILTPEQRSKLRALSKEN